MRDAHPAGSSGEIPSLWWRAEHQGAIWEWAWRAPLAIIIQTYTARRAACDF
jgi:hypothetical protein